MLIVLLIKLLEVPRSHPEKLISKHTGTLRIETIRTVLYITKVAQAVS